MSEVQRSSLTTLPQAITESILCLLPTKEAARTSILSTDWRYKWTTIPKLKFDGSSYVFKKSTKEKIPTCRGWEQMSDIERARNKEIRREYLNAIHQVLLLRQGPIHEFTLEIDTHDTSFEIDQIILHLSRNHIIKKLTLTSYGSHLYDLPSSFFSLSHLTDLYLTNCAISHKFIFNGFGSLTSLYIDCLSNSTKGVLHLLSKCPSLKSLYLQVIDDILGDESPDVVDLFKCLPMIEHLTISCYFIQLLVQVSISEELPTSLIHLKYFTIEDMSFVEDYGLPFLCDLIKCSPNLEKIKLEINIEDYYDEVEEYSEALEEYSFEWEEYSDVWLEHLKEVEIEDFANFKPEFEFVKFILARSPGLKKVALRTYGVNKNEQLEILESLLRTPRASPVEIVVENSLKHSYNYE